MFRWILLLFMKIYSCRLQKEGSGRELHLLYMSYTYFL